MMMLGAIVCLFGLVLGQSNGTEWLDARATFYGHEQWIWSIHQGSCEYGYLCPNEGTGWDVAALPDTHRDYKGYCGRCYEVKCHGVMFLDSFNNTLDRSNVCFDQEQSIVVRIVDTCPCNDVKSQYSNQRWCCADMDHLDLSIWAFEKLADPKWGVMGLKYRQVPCDHQPETPAVALANPFPGTPVPESETCSKGVWEARDTAAAVAAPTYINTGLIYTNGIQEFWEFSNWNAEVFEIPDAGYKAGSAVCGRLFPGGAISFLGAPGVFVGQMSLKFWVKGTSDAGLPTMDVNIAGDSGECTGVAISGLTPSGSATGYTSFSIYLGLFAQEAPDTVVAFASAFKGCGGMQLDQIRRVSFKNNLAVEQALCIDDVQLLG